MYSITFTKGDEVKDTFKDFLMIPETEVHGFDNGGDGTAKFVMRYSSIPISTRVNDLAEFLNGIVVGEFSSDDSHKKYKGYWTVDHSSKANVINVGSEVILTFKPVLEEVKKDISKATDEEKPKKQNNKHKYNKPVAEEEKKEEAILEGVN